MNFGKILVVCVGNICRSPTAEFLLARSLPRMQVSSAGLAAVVGADMDPNARLVAQERGLICPTHVARQLTREHCSDADLILVMESRHRDAVTKLCPEARGKTFLLDVSRPAKDIHDPYRRDKNTFERIYAQLAAGCEAWAQKLDR